MIDWLACTLVKAIGWLLCRLSPRAAVRLGGQLGLLTYRGPPQPTPL